jgi:hypothetical protein
LNHHQRRSKRVVCSGLVEEVVSFVTTNSVHGQLVWVGAVYSLQCCQELGEEVLSSV